MSFRRDALNSELHAEWLSENLAKRQVGGQEALRARCCGHRTPALGGSATSLPQPAPRPSDPLTLWSPCNVWASSVHLVGSAASVRLMRQLNRP